MYMSKNDFDCKLIHNAGCLQNFQMALRSCYNHENFANTLKNYKLCTKHFWSSLWTLSTFLEHTWGKFLLPCSFRVLLLLVSWLISVSLIAAFVIIPICTLTIFVIGFCARPYFWWFQWFFRGCSSWWISVGSWCTRWWSGSLSPFVMGPLIWEDSLR